MELAERLDRAYGMVHGIVHAAAAFSGLVPLAHRSPKTGCASPPSLTAPFLVTQACLPLLQRVPDAAVVFLGDALGRRAGAYWGAYAVSKFGIEGLASVLADEVESAGTPRVACVNPGPMRTALRRRAFPVERPGAAREPGAVAGGLLFALDRRRLPHGAFAGVG